MALGMFQEQSDYMKVCGICLNTQAKQFPVGMIRSAGGLFTIYTWKVANKQKTTGKSSMGIGAVEEAKEAEIGEVIETNDMDVEME